MELKFSFNFLFASFPLSSFDLKRTEKEDKWNFNSRYPVILEENADLGISVFQISYS